MRRRFTDFSTIKKIKHVFTNPATCDSNQLPELTEEILKLQNDINISYNTSGVDFWKLLSVETYPKLSATILKTLVMFSTTYCCESGFSILQRVKNEYK